jgi:uncharacterized protein YukE
MGWSRVAKFLMRLARRVLQDVLSKLEAQRKAIEDQIESITSFFSILESAWEGEDCEAFINEVKTDMIPEITALVGAVVGICSSIQSSVDIMDQADNKAASAVDNIRDAFSKVTL